MKTALVIGSRKTGIGSAVATRLVADGYEVHSLSDSVEPGDGRVKGLQTDSEIDVADVSSLARAIAAVPVDRIDAIAYADFYFSMESQANFDWETWQRSIAANLTAPHVVFRESQSRMTEQSAFCIVTSTEAFAGSFGASAYAASKAAVHNLVMTLANLNGDKPTRVNAVAAGWIGGVMDTDEVFNMSRRITPLGRLGTPEEVAAVVSFLLGPESSFVNGSVVVVDGGYSGVDTIAKYEFEAEARDE